MDASVPGFKGDESIFTGDEAVLELPDVLDRPRDLPHLGEPSLGLPWGEWLVAPEVKHVVASVQAGCDLWQCLTALAQLFKQRAFTTVSCMRCY